MGPVGVLVVVADPGKSAFSACPGESVVCVSLMFFRGHGRPSVLLSGVMPIDSVMYFIYLAPYA